MNWKIRNVYRRPEEGGDGGGAAAPAAAPAATAPAPAAPAAAPAPSAAAPSPAAAAPAAAPAPAADDKAYWPADWRQKVAGEDEKELEHLNRRASTPADLWKNYRALEKRLASGELKPTLGKNPTEEEVTAYRKANGIPETADKYALGADVQIKEEAAPTIGKVFEAAHKVNMAPDQVKAMVKVVQDIQRDELQTRTEKDNQLRVTAEDTLHKEWGGEYRTNLNRIHNVLDAAGPQSIKGSLLDGRLADGRRIGDAPEVIQFLDALARVYDPVGIVPGGDSTNPLASISDEKATIEKVMKENRAAYNKDPAMQERYRALIDAELKLTRKPATTR